MLQGFVRVTLKAIGKSIEKITGTSSLYTAALAVSPAGMNWNAYHAKGFLDLCIVGGSFATTAFSNLIASYSATTTSPFTWAAEATSLGLVDFAFGYGYTDTVPAGFLLYACALAAYENAASWGTAYSVHPDTFATTDVGDFATAFTA